MLDAVCCVLCAGGGDDTMLTMAWSKIGDYYADRQRWTKALQYYGQAKELEKMVSASYMLEDFSGIERIMQARLYAEHRTALQRTPMSWLVGQCRRTCAGVAAL